MRRATVMLTASAMVWPAAGCVSFPDDCFESGCDTGFRCANTGMCVPDGQGPGAPRFVSADPAPNSLDGDADEIAVTFSQPMRPANDTSFSVRSNRRGRLTGQFSNDGPTLTFMPTRTVRAGTEVQVSLRTVLEASNGSGRLATPYVFKFEVESEPSTGEFTLLPGPELTAGLPTARLRVVDVGDDDQLEVLAVIANEVRVFGLDTAGGLRSDAALATFGSDVQDIAVADFNQDGRLDVYTASFQANQHRPFFGDGALDFTPLGSLPAAFGITRLQTADINGDGAPDLAGVLADPDQSDDAAAFVAINNGNGTFLVSDPIASGAPPGLRTNDIAIADMNSDGVLDLVLLSDQTDRGPGSISVLLRENDAYRRLEPIATQAVVDSMTVGDFDGDGDVDIAVGQRLPLTVAVFANDGDGRLLLALSQAATAVDHLSSADIDGDGDRDIVTDAVTVLENQTDGTTFSEGPQARGGDVNALADVDGDGDIDVVISEGEGIRVLRND